MVPMEGKHCWMFAVEIAILFHGILLKNSICESSATDEMCRQKNVLFVSNKKLDETETQQNHFPTKAVYRNVNGTKLFFNIRKNNADCHPDFDCRYTVLGVANVDKVYLILNNETLSKQDIVLMKEPSQLYGYCWPSELYGKGFFVNIHFCLDKGIKNIRFTQKDLSREGEQYNKGDCNVSAQTGYQCIIAEGKGCVLCNAPDYTTALTSVSISTSPESTVSSTSPGSTESTVSSTSPESTVSSTNTGSTVSSTNTGTTVSSTNPGSTINDTRTNLEIAVDIMNNLSSMLGDLNTKHLTVGDVKGVITRLPLNNHTDINVAISSGEFTILKQMIDSQFSQSVHITKNASAMAVKKNSSSAGVLLVPGIYPAKHNPNSSFVGSMAVGIEMGAEISGLSPAVDIHFRNVNKSGKIASCRSWDGKGKEQNWITDGCQTNETSDGITCRCSHLTFFAILLSPPAKNISASDFKSLTYITSVGCGLSMFFLAVGLFMHFLIRKGKASRATVILINLFVAMFNLNLSFLVNELIANLGIFGACVAIAAVMHYTMLATFSWFFIQALHLYINLRTLHTDIKHYMVKIYIAGWGEPNLIQLNKTIPCTYTSKCKCKYTSMTKTLCCFFSLVTPAAVVIGLLAAGKYDYLFIYTNDGNSAKMCWISDAVVHQGVNIGYYAIVFIFTFSIFIMTVGHIVGSKPAAEKARNVSSIKTNSFSILGLFLLLGITWAFAFFSYGPMLTASYYIFTILNSFQGFFLFIYYYNSSKVVQEAGSVSSSSITTSNKVICA